MSRLFDLFWLTQRFPRAHILKHDIEGLQDLYNEGSILFALQNLEKVPVDVLFEEVPNGLSSKVAGER